MAGKTLDIRDVVIDDRLGEEIANFWISWNQKRQTKINAWRELREYIYATDTSHTSADDENFWNNKTTIPALTRVRDNLHANYIAAMFPKTKWVMWEGASDDDDSKEKSESIENYIYWAMEHSGFIEEMEKLVYDFIDYGNVFPTVEWVDERIEDLGGNKVGYVGPRVRRINPLDLVMNPVAPSFKESPKIVRSLMTMGEARKVLDQLSGDKEEAEEIFNYMQGVRERVASHSGNLSELDHFLNIDGFDDFRGYLDSNYVEILTFYGDAYDYDNNEFLPNHVITVVDRHKVISKKLNPSMLGTPPIYHAGWRPRQDNLWAMGPLDNLVGMQFRIDHVENMKADVLDLIVAAPVKVKGDVQDFDYRPFEKIYVGDNGEVELMTPPYQVLQSNIEIDQYIQKMEEMAGAPKEALGIRTPGEKTAFEVQRLENAASRIFQSKIKLFEQQVVEPILNAMLELARRYMDPSTIRVFDSELKIATFLDLTAEDLTGNGRIVPVAARHFAEKAEKIQNLNNFFGGPMGQDPNIKVHFSGIKLAQLAEELLDLEPHNIVQEFIAITEQADAQRIANSNEEEVQVEAQTPAGLSPDDTSGGPPLA